MVKKKNAFQTTVDLPSGVAYDPDNPNHVKYYNKKIKEDGKGKAEKKQLKVENDIKKGKPINTEEESIIIEDTPVVDDGKDKDKDKG